MNKIDFINKMKMWSICKFFAIAAMVGSAFLSSSCENYLDIDSYVYDQTTLDSIFQSKARTEQYINGAAELLFDESIQIGEWSGKAQLPCGMGSDEAILPWIGGSQPGNMILIDEITPNSTQLNPWPQCYKGIRKANIILANIERNKELTDMEARDFRGRAYFLRAYFYFYLVRLYGPVPIVPDVPFATDVDVASASLERSTYDVCVEKICADFEKAAEYLPVERIETQQFLPTRGAALAIKARMELYAASPLFNGNTYYDDWKDSNGTPFISQTEDKSKWGKAAATFKRIIDMNKYTLHTVQKIINDKGTGTLPLPETVSEANFPDGAGNIDPYQSYKTLFDGTYQSYTNKEYIYYFKRNTIEDHFYFPTRLGGQSTYAVTLDMVEAYKMADGRNYEDATEAEKSWKAVGSPAIFAGNYQLSAERAHRDDNREPRYYASIGFNYCVWPCDSYRGQDPLKNFEAVYAMDGNSTDQSNNDNRNRTGYTCRKYLHQEDINTWDGSKKAKVYPVSRYAEVLLGYVEALNEMDGSYTDAASGVTVTKDVNQMVYYFNQVRFRAGQPGITTAEAGDYQKMKELIKHEWRIEFAFESRRYWDLRRWKDAYDAYNKPIRGLSVSSSKVAQREQLYTIKVLNTERCMKRVFNNKMYFWPIDRSVLQKNGKLVQNPEWR